ncbi:hypothetical protein [Streptomyces sp. NPDC049585]|uniref:hypothetical protein n=1 Tax=Streptomyces sp. NPDC049585 TaxID=3155154 RepID=UPI003431162F
MSRSRNANRLAKRLCRQTTLKQSTASRLAKQVRVYLGSPVPDASASHQRRLEAHITHVLADGFQDRQLNGALFGVREVRATAQHLELVLESAMADEVVHELLPRFDEHYGGIRGVAGLRVQLSSRAIVLGDALSSARIAVTRTDGQAWRLPTARDGETLLGDTRGLSPEERLEADEWAESIPSFADVPLRDLLLSRLLRRPALVNRAAEPHGFANCYTHHSGDLVIEWCCGDTVEALCATLLAHGFIDGVPPSDAVELASPQSILLGGDIVILRRHSTCLYGRSPFGVQEINEYIREGYES